jgi:hypothetical protein
MRGLHRGAALLWFLSVMGAGGTAFATEVGDRRNFGLGLGLGTATSLVGKFFVDPDSAVDFGVSFWRYRGGCWEDGRGVLTCDAFGDGRECGA